MRHAEYENPQNIFIGRLGVPLTAEGRARAERVGRELKDAGIRKIFSSNVERCDETSRIVAEILEVDVYHDKRLLEHLSPIQGMSLDEYHKDRNLRFTSVDTLGGETMMDVQVRMLDFFYEKMKEEEGDILICSHGDPLYFLYAGLSGKNLPKEATDFDPSKDYQPMGSYRKVEIEGDQFVVGPITVL